MIKLINEASGNTIKRDAEIVTFVLHRDDGKDHHCIMFKNPYGQKIWYDYEDDKTYQANLNLLRTPELVTITGQYKKIG